MWRNNGYWRQRLRYFCIEYNTLDYLKITIAVEVCFVICQGFVFYDGETYDNATNFDIRYQYGGLDFDGFVYMWVLCAFNVIFLYGNIVYHMFSYELLWDMTTDIRSYVLFVHVMLFTCMLISRFDTSCGNVKKIKTFSFYHMKSTYSTKQVTIFF